MTEPSLADLRDLHLPPTPTLAGVADWQIVAVLLLLLLLLAATLWWGRRWLRRRSQRAALRELAGLARAHGRAADPTRLIRGLSGLLRRYAMVRFADVGVAGLSGPAWLQFLDAHGGDGAFVQGVGAVFESRPYQASGAYDEAALLALVRRWLQANPP
jgi:hypothetical protein